MLGYLRRCRLCGFSWGMDSDVTYEAECPRCNVEFAGHERVLVSCDSLIPRITESWLLRYLGPYIASLTCMKDVADLMTSTQTKLGLDVQEDLSVVQYDPEEVSGLWYRRRDGTFYRTALPSPWPSPKVIMIRDGHGQLYGIDCMAGLLTGWRAAIGDS